MFKGLFLIFYIFALAMLAFAKPCKYWCKNAKWEYYCCPEHEEAKVENPWNSMMGVLIPHLWLALGFPKTYHHGYIPWEKAKPEKKCPPIRHSCPRSSDWWFDPPTPCYHDDECISSAKCCFDICLNHKTCKPAEML